MSKPSVQKVIKELKAIAKHHGYEVRCYTYSRLKDKTYIRNFTPWFPSGEFDRHKKRIIIRKYKNTFAHAVMCVMAHEIRHLLHDVAGRYPKYYSNKHYLDIIKYMRGEPIENFDESCFLQGIEAEKDCDRWAKHFLYKKGYQYGKQMNKPYPISNVMGYDLYSWFIRQGKECMYMKPLGDQKKTPQ